MKPIEYDVVTIYPVLTHDKYEIIYRKKKFFQIKKTPDGKYHILINKLKIFYTLEVDGLDMMFACRDCTLKYGQIIKGKKGLLTNRHFCPVCHKGI